MLLEILTNVRGALPDVILWCGVISGLVVLSEFIFSDEQKKQIELLFLRCWSWLDDIRNLEYLRRFQRSEANARLIAILHILYMVAALLVAPALGLSRIVAVGTVVGALASLVLCRKMRGLIEWMTAPATLLGYLRRMLMVGVPIGVAIATATLFTIFLIAISNVIIEEVVKQSSFAEDIFAFVGFIDIIIITFLGGFVSVQAYYWGICLAYLVLVMILVAVVGALWFLFLKLSEYPKGPLLAISGLASIVGAVAKFFT